jgi:3-(3-hydroxy-phenyl)propionate hydroxylase
MDAHFGCGWRLVVDEALQPPLSPTSIAPGLEVIVLGSGTATRELDGVVATWMQRNACHAALVRPDHYVFGTAATTDQLAALLAECRAALAH